MSWVVMWAAATAATPEVTVRVAGGEQGPVVWTVGGSAPAEPVRWRTESGAERRAVAWVGPVGADRALLGAVIEERVRPADAGASRVTPWVVVSRPLLLIGAEGKARLIVGRSGEAPTLDLEASLLAPGPYDLPDAARIVMFPEELVEARYVGAVSTGAGASLQCVGVDVAPELRIDGYGGVNGLFKVELPSRRLRRGAEVRLRCVVDDGEPGARTVEVVFERVGAAGS